LPAAFSPIECGKTVDNQADVLIVGGGVIGLTTAYRLALQHVSVTVVDRQAIGREASWAGAGMLPPGNLANAHTPESRLRSYSHQLWPALSADLKQRTGIDNGYRRCGAIEVFGADERDVFHSQVMCWRKEGIEIDDLDRAGLEMHAAGLDDRFQSGVFLPHFGQARNPRHLKSLAAACQQLGVEIVEYVDDLTLQSTENGVVSAQSPSRRFSADRVCVAAGSWTPRILEPLNITLPVKPVRGQIAQIRVPQLSFSCVVEQGRRYLVPRPDGLILVGSTQEYVGFEKRNTTEGVAGLLSFAESIAPELGGAEVVRCWAGLRPGSPDELPFLGQVPDFENLFVGAGHFRSGLQMSPGTGHILADLLMDRVPEIALDGLSCDPQRWNPTTRHDS
jgi:glycine oxidase